MRIVLISDTHLARSAAAFTANAEAAVDWIETQAPDLVVHLGDVTADAAAEPEQFGHARAVLGRISAPLLAVPGNHDVGEVPPHGGAKEPAFDPVRLAEFQAALGPDHWIVRRDGWTLIGLDVQRFGSPEEDEQDAWLAAELAGTAGPVALFLHKPLFLDGPDEESDHPRFVPPAARRRLIAALASHDLRLAASGHVHQARRRRVDGAEHLWVPSTAFVIPDALQPRLGDKLVGLVALELTADGFKAETVTPPGLVAHDVLDHPEVYPQVIALRRSLG